MSCYYLLSLLLFHFVLHCLGCLTNVHVPTLARNLVDDTFPAIGVLTFMSRGSSGSCCLVDHFNLTPIVLQVLSIALLNPLMYGRHRRGTLSVCVPICCGLSLSDLRFNILLSLDTH